MYVVHVCQTFETSVVLYLRAASCCPAMMWHMDIIDVQALGLEGDAETIDSWPSGEDVVSGRRRPGAGVSIRQPHLLCGLPADTPTRLLFGLLLPLSMGWHVTLAPAPAEDPQGDKLWHLLCGDDTGVGGHASEGAVPYDACYIASAACDMLTRHALEALGGRASSLNGVGGSAAFSAALSKMAVCALFGPSATPATIQSFVASMLPFGLRYVPPLPQPPSSTLAVA